MGILLNLIWATPCDGNSECYDNYDEEHCVSPIWLSPVILFASGFLLFIAMIWYIFKNIDEGIDALLVNGEASHGQFANSRSKQAICIAIITDLGDIESITNIFNMEIDAHGSKGEAICCLKVQIIFFIHYMNPVKKSWRIVQRCITTQFQNLLDSETFIMVKQMQETKSFLSKLIIIAKEPLIGIAKKMTDKMKMAWMLLRDKKEYVVTKEEL